ncbi:Sulfate adenylyltransferase [Porphyridium purpureum]|uniref:Sulfate adenylyltransferase n=1 Tax=Porphyridium purpureum TaxID=35688 RepID=A0A5J4Z714_PORPP|nr:Sulfate adenylyltransferase [Porphyridium purpureum]|eukprot:POR0930..scf295_1
MITAVHGGLDAPVNRIVSDLGEIELLPKVQVSEVDLTTMYRIADGTLSPLTGPMNKDVYDMVLASKCIESQGAKYAWTIPIVLPATAEEAKKAVVGEKMLLVTEGEMKPFGVITVGSCYEWDPKAFIKAVYLTEREDHPGAKLWLSETRPMLIGGDIEVVVFADTRSFKEYVMGPTQVRALFEEKQYDFTIAFQTRNPLHRAHEYALVYGAETLLRQFDSMKVGVVLNPLVGQLKGDDVPADARMKTYIRLIEEKHLGEGDADVELWNSKKQSLLDQTHLIGLDMRMYYGGPSEAVMHSIYRQNLGFTHFIVGRKHADAPYSDGTPIWGDFDAQEIFSNLGGDLKIKTVNVGFAAYFEELGRVGLVAENKGKHSVSISGTKIREMLTNGEKPDSRVMRECTAEVLIEFYKSKATAE